MTRVLSTWATAVSTIMAMIITLGLIYVSTADARPVFTKMEDIKGESTENASTDPAGRTVKSAGGKVCCSVPRKGKLALVKSAECRKVKGRVVPRSRCARVRPVSAAKFSNLVLKRGIISRGASRKSGPAASSPRSVSPGAQLGYVNCSGGGYFPCWCTGAGTCNNFIAACVEIGGDLNCTEHNSQGQPTGCSCYK